jgi:CheY-like chemotaxis protein
VVPRLAPYDESVASPADATRARKTVLIVEDDDDLRALYRDWLKYAGFDVIETADGIDALQIIDSSPPDVIVLDIRLPTLDGVSVREEIAADGRTRDIPVVVVTGTPVDASRLKATRLLKKPITREQLLVAVRDAVG